MTWEDRSTKQEGKGGKLNPWTAPRVGVGEPERVEAAAGVAGDRCVLGDRPDSHLHPVGVQVQKLVLAVAARCGVHTVDGGQRHPCVRGGGGWR